jgi:hypothetical protein
LRLQLGRADATQLITCDPLPHRNLFDSWLGTDNVAANVGSILTGLSVMLLFRIFKLPLAEFW